MDEKTEHENRCQNAKSVGRCCGSYWQPATVFERMEDNSDETKANISECAILQVIIVWACVYVCVFVSARRNKYSSVDNQPREDNADVSLYGKREGENKHQRQRIPMRQFCRTKNEELKNTLGDKNPRCG